MPLQVTHQNNVKIYSITSGARSALPDWLSKRKSKILKHDVEYRTRIELIQDFQFPEASLRIKYTPDGNYVIATGVYKPHMRVFDLAELSMKFDRFVDAENVDFVILSDDWTKTVHLNNDRTVEFHTQFGMHYRTRIPKFGRGLAYYHPSCDLYVVGSTSEVYRLNLEQGRFYEPLLTSSPENNIVTINPAHGLLAFGGEDGNVEFWHPNSRNRLARLDVATWMATLGSREVGGLDTFPAISAIEFNSDGLTCAVGTQSGHVMLYDLRKPVPYVVKDHQYGMPIKRVLFHPSGNVVSADTKAVRFWNKDTGKAYTAVEPPNDINDFCIQADSGLLMLANEGVDMQTYYIPQLGPAPKWCPFLDNLTEEFEENPEGQTLYDDYKFVTRAELTRLGLDHLVGTNILKAYMHGFFVDLRLYQKAKAIADPFEYEQYRKEMIQKRKEKEQGSRIHVKRTLPSVNRNLALKMMEAEENQAEQEEGEDEDAFRKKNKKKKAPAVQKDDRFGALFEDQDFQIDEASEEWRLRHPSEAKQRSVIALENYQKVQEIQSKQSAADGEDDEEDLYISGLNAFSKTKAEKPKKKLQLYELKEGAQPFQKQSIDTGLTLADRLRAGEADMNDGDRVVAYAGGNKSLTFKPSDASKKRRDAEENEERRERRAGKRGIGELRLKRGVEDVGGVEEVEEEEGVDVDGGGVEGTFDLL
ncbi:Nucleolar protein 10 [Phlyctochytrium bullatum]|nr:Nucleolar protein 10 [Phlyctochytrium bullatum]